MEEVRIDLADQHAKGKDAVASSGANSSNLARTTWQLRQPIKISFQGRIGQHPRPARQYVPPENLRAVHSNTETLRHLQAVHTTKRS